MKEQESILDPDRRFNQKKNKEYWRQQEKRVADRLEGDRQRGSGNQAGHRGDVKTPVLLIDAKSTGRQSISIKIKDLQKISMEALQEVPTRIPALSIAFEDSPVGMEEDWLLLPAYFIEKLLNAED